MTKTRVPNNYRTIDTYKVTGKLVNLTNQQLIDYCDPNAFGGHVRRYGDYVAYVEVDID
jgi:hypothetical protein